MPVTVVKSVKHELCLVLAHSINLSFVSGIFPNELKIPIHKWDEKKNYLNWRPVSLLPSISKVHERIVHFQLMAFLEKHNLLDDSQHGICSEISVISVAVEF